MADGNYWLSHDAQDVDDVIDEVQAARGSEESLSARLADIVGDFESDQQRQDAVIEAGALRFQDSGNIRLNQLSWSQTYSGTGFWIADAFVVTEFETVVSAMITTFGALRPTEVASLWLYLPSSVVGMKTIRVVCDRDLTGLTSNPTIKIRAFGYGYQASSLQSAPASLMQAGRIDAEQAAAELEEGVEA